MTYQPGKTGGLIIEDFTVKSEEDIELGEIVVVDGGIVAATTAHGGPFFAALAEHDYSAESTHTVPCGVMGQFEVQCVPAAAIEKGDYVEMSTTTGAVTLSDLTAFDDVVGIAMEAAATTDTCMDVLLGVAP